MATLFIDCFFFSLLLNRIPQKCSVHSELVRCSTNDVTGRCSTPGRDVTCTALSNNDRSLERLIHSDLAISA